MKICTKGGDKRDSAADVLVPPILIVHQGTPRDGKSPSRSLETLSSTQQLQLGPFFHPQNNKSSLFRLKSDFFSWVETGQYIQRQQNLTPCPASTSAQRSYWIKQINLSSTEPILPNSTDFIYEVMQKFIELQETQEIRSWRVIHHVCCGVKARRSEAQWAAQDLQVFIFMVMLPATGWYASGARRHASQNANRGKICKTARLLKAASYLAWRRS